MKSDPTASSDCAESLEAPDMKRERFVDMEAFSRSIMLDRRGNRHKRLMPVRTARSSRHRLSWGKRL